MSAKEREHVEKLYGSVVGMDALVRQKQARAAGRCDYCWAPPDAPHSGLCPNRPEDEESAPPTQDEGLF